MSTHENFCAEPPEVLRVDEKNLREHNILNVCGPIFTTNHKTNGIHLDRGLTVATTWRGPI